jgi:23S rRNA pseudouridine1911/1915/1917 synthase
MDYDKAYKVLAQQEKISNSKAKELIDKGLVFVGNKQVQIARGEIKTDTRFIVKHVEKTEIIFQDDDILAVNKPAFLTAQEIADRFSDCMLLNRLDKQTSGVMLFAKNEAFQKKAIAEFKHNRVYKEYVAIVEGKVIEEIEIDKPILTIKTKGVAKSKVDEKKGKPARTVVYPLFVEGNKSKVKVVIDTGRTHQIRVHLNYMGLPIIGDSLYGKPLANIKRVLLHSRKTKILGYEFEAKEPKEFNVFGLNSY